PGGVLPRAGPLPAVPRGVEPVLALCGRDLSLRAIRLDVRLAARRFPGKTHAQRLARSPRRFTQE
ncbi:hypothetical protein ACFQ08_23785, partial [Streptosporangium algeriense]